MWKARPLLTNLRKFLFRLLLVVDRGAAACAVCRPRQMWKEWFGVHRRSNLSPSRVVQLSTRRPCGTPASPAVPQGLQGSRQTKDNMGRACKCRNYLRMSRIQARCGQTGDVPGHCHLKASEAISFSVSPPCIFLPSRGSRCRKTPSVSAFSS